MHVSDFQPAKAAQQPDTNQHLLTQSLFTPS